MVRERRSRGPYESGQGGVPWLSGRALVLRLGRRRSGVVAVRVANASGGHLKMVSSNLVQPKRMRQVKLVMKVEFYICAMPCLPRREGRIVL